MLYKVVLTTFFDYKVIIQTTVNNNKSFSVNDTIRMYEKGKIKMYKNVHKINPKVHSFVIL